MRSQPKRLTITLRDLALLRYLSDKIAQAGQCPTYQEAATDHGVNPSSIYYHATKLLQGRFLSRNSHYRGLYVTERGRDALLAVEGQDIEAAAPRQAFKSPRNI